MKHIPIAELARVVHQRAREFKPMALISAYFDESGTDGQRGVTTLAGFFGSERQWTALEESWLRDLNTYEVPRGKFGIPVMHLVDALEGRGDFSHLGSKRHDLIMGLSKMLGESGVTCLFSGVLDDAWNEVVLSDASFLARFPKPLDLCFEDIVRQMQEMAIANPQHRRPALIFSRQEEYYERMLEVVRAYATSPKNNLLGSITFSTPHELAPLQCADFIAHEMRYDIEQVNYGKLTLGRSILRNATPKGEPGHYFDRNGLLLTLERFKRTGEIY